ncbi:MAG: hypothetical protein HGB05_03595 [Chloroflexi bacterium]|nr:hypothetical protein [Chloroflexota bacterium]
MERYEIVIKGHLDPRRAGQFDDLIATAQPDGTTQLAGPVADQAALHGLLSRIRDLGLPLMSVTRIDPSAGCSAG